MDFNQARITPQMWIQVLSRLLLFGNEQVIYSLDEERKKTVIAFLSALQKIRGGNGEYADICLEQEHSI